MAEAISPGSLSAPLSCAVHASVNSFKLREMDPASGGPPTARESGE